jgi:hypothetical protein
MENPYLDQLFALEFFLAAATIFLDTLDGL